MVSKFCKIEPRVRRSANGGEPLATVRKVWAVKRPSVAVPPVRNPPPNNDPSSGGLTVSGTADYSWLHLGDDEYVRWQRRPHPIALGTAFAGGLLLALAGFVVAAWAFDGVSRIAGWIALLVALGGIGVAAIRYAYWTNTRYVLTSRQLYAKRGVVSRDVSQVSLERVQNTTLNQSVAGRLLGYGNLSVYTAGSGKPEMTFIRVPEPSVASASLADQLNELDGPNRSNLS